VPVLSCTADGLNERAFLDEGLVRELETGGAFWLDLHRPSREELELLARMFRFHPLAVEDTLKFGQRPKLEDYDDHAFLVLFGWSPDEDGLVEVHCYYTGRFLVTVRQDESPAIVELQHRYAAGTLPTGISLLHRVADALVDSFFPAISRFDDRLDLIEDELIARPKEEHLRDVFTMKRRLSILRRAIAPQRDLMGKIAAGGVDLHGLTAESERYFRDVYDHLIRLTEMLDTQRDLMTAAVDVYLSASSNRMNEVMKALTVIATVFLPLTFVTGFFGQNFPWLVAHIGGVWWFLGVGIGTELLTVALLVAWFRRRGWL
jgi:magnesium transporter